MTERQDRDPIEVAVDAILAHVPEGYGMRVDEARAYARAAVSTYLRQEAKRYPRVVGVTRYRNPGFLLHELANEAEGMEE